MIGSVMSEKKVSANSIIKWLLYGINIGVSIMSCNVVYNLMVLKDKKLIDIFMREAFNVTMYTESVTDMLVNFFMIIFAIIFVGNIMIVARFCGKDIEARQNIRRLMRAIGYNMKKRLLYEYLYICVDMIFSLPIAVMLFVGIKCICNNTDAINQLFIITGDSAFKCMIQCIFICMVYAVTALVVTMKRSD